MAGAAMRELYDKQSLAKQKEDGKNGGRKGGRPKVNNETLVAKVPQGLSDEDTVKPDAVSKKTSTKTRDQVGKLVGVSGRYIDDATKQKQGSDVPPW